MIETVKITKVFVSDKSKEGKPFTTSKGKPFWKIAIKTDRYPDDWMSALAFAQDDAEMNLKEGDEVKILIETNGQYKNFKLPSRIDQLEERVAALENTLRAMNMGKLAVKPENNDVPEISDDDLPF
jgi:hypothetical protein